MKFLKLSSVYSILYYILNKKLKLNISVDSRNFKKWGRSPTTAQNVGEGLKILGDDFMIKFKLMENTFSVYLDIFNSGLPLISDQGHLATQ